MVERSTFDHETLKSIVDILPSPESVEIGLSLSDFRRELHKEYEFVTMFSGADEQSGVPCRPSEQLVYTIAGPPSQKVLRLVTHSLEKYRNITLFYRDDVKVSITPNTICVTGQREPTYVGRLLEVLRHETNSVFPTFKLRLYLPDGAKI